MKLRELLFEIGSVSPPPLALADEGLPAPIVFVTNVLQLSEDQTRALMDDSDA